MPDAGSGDAAAPAVEAPVVEATVPAGHEGERLDRVLAALFDQFSRARLQRWVRDGRVAVDGAPCRDTRARIHGGEHIVVTPETPGDDTLVGEALALDVVYRDDHLLVVDKPAGLVVHPGAGNPSGTLVNALVHLDPGLAGLPRAGLVHRLDKNTSGLLLIGCTLEAHTALVRMMSRREIRRRYEAVVHGATPPSGTVDAPVGRHRQVRTRMGVHDGGRPARTHYRRLAALRAHTHLALELDTGRTHQIRVHMAHISHPVVGDRDYGGVRPAPTILGAAAAAAVTTFPRQALHARHLDFEHPLSGDDLAFSSPLPDDMAHLLAALSADSA